MKQIATRDHEAECAYLRALHDKPVIAADDLAAHNWSIAFDVACYYFDKCDQGARAFLINHGRAGVRSAAKIAEVDGPDKSPPRWFSWDEWQGAGGAA